MTPFSVRPLDYLRHTAFRIKLLLLILAVANAAAFTSFKLHRQAERMGARIMALISIGLWISVAVAGRFIGFLV